MNLTQRPHRRFNPLLDEWVLVSPQRLDRPWLGRVEAPPPAAQPPYDPSCYLCPGNARAGNARNPRYASTFVFDNDFPALLPPPPQEPQEPPEPKEPQEPKKPQEPRVLIAEPVAGVCRVVCFSPRHDASLPCLSISEVREVVDVWVDQFGALTRDFAYVQIFENRGAAMGASNPHPHCQIWASSTVPHIPAREQASFERFQAAHRSCLLCAYAAEERRRGDRHVVSNDAFTAVVPFWAVWPFETLVVSARHVAALDELTPDERTALADILKRVTASYDRLFSAPCPYSMGFHQRPAGGPHPEWHLHAHFYPPVLRSATVHKFMVGYELLASPQRDLTAERAAAMLKEASS